jgi:hypothetical protein
MNHAWLTRIGPEGGFIWAVEPLAHSIRVWADPNPLRRLRELIVLMNKEYDPPLDPGIKQAVELLQTAGIETYESCEGGPGHSYKEPTIRFYGGRSEGFKALAVALENNLPVSALRRTWSINDDEPTGPTWEIVFWRKVE